MSAPMQGLNSDERQARYDAWMKTAEWLTFSWQCKRDAGFKCALCSASGVEQLETHHWWYDRERFPWDVEAGQVAVLCKGCHDGLHAQLTTLRTLLQGRWASGTVGFGEFMQAWCRYLFAACTPEMLSQINARLALGTQAKGPIAGETINALAKLAASRQRGPVVWTEEET